MRILPKFWSSRTLRLLLLSFVCVLLPTIAVEIVEQRRKASVLWENSGGFKNRSTAEHAALQKLLQILNAEQRVNLLWARYNVAVFDSKGKVVGLRLAAIGYNREQRSLVHLIIDPNFKTRSNPPTRYDIYTPVSPTDLAQLVRSQGRVDDIRQVVPNVTMRTRVVPDGEKYDETTLP